MTSVVSVNVGKVRDSLLLSNGTRILRTTDRVSAFDCVLPFCVPGKGALLQAISVRSFERASAVMPTHFLGTLSDQCMLVRNAEVLPLELVVRGTLSGSLWRLYESAGPAAVRDAYDILLDPGLAENAPFPEPLLTPTSKAAIGHDLPLTPESCVQRLDSFLARLPEGQRGAGPVPWNGETLWNAVRAAALALFEAGKRDAMERGLVLVDTKYEMGLVAGELTLVDEVHTPDSSRYWRAVGAREAPLHLSKEALREELRARFGDAELRSGRLALSERWSREAGLAAGLAERLGQRYRETFEALVPGGSPHAVSARHFVPWPVARAEAERTLEEHAAPKRVLIAGTGGRDVSLFRYFSSLPDVERVYGPASCPHWGPEKHMPFPDALMADPAGLAAFAAAAGIGLLVVGPEAPICAGVADACAALGVPVVAPAQAAGRLESSKAFCKDVALSAGVRTAKGEIQRWSELEKRLESGLVPLPCVVKYDGLASGKGVFVLRDAADAAEALARLRALLPGLAPSASGECVFLIEECLQGKEISAFALCAGDRYWKLPHARDYKQRNDGGTGPNTGGMGSVCPVPVEPRLDAEIDVIFARTLAEMRKRDLPYFGFLFAGIMIDAQQRPWLLEFNCRLGDPEAQVLLPGLGRDFIRALKLAAKVPALLDPAFAGTPGARGEGPAGMPQARGEGPPKIRRDVLRHDALARVFVVGAAQEYPEGAGPPARVERQEGAQPRVERLAETPSRLVRAAGIPPADVSVDFIPSAVDPDGIAKGGRLFGYLGTAPTIPRAREAAYVAMESTVLIPLAAGSTPRPPHFRRDVAAEFTS